MLKSIEKEFIVAMKKSSKVFFCSISLLFALTVKAQQKIYVSVDGSDGNNGSISQPLKTIKKAQQIARTYVKKSRRASVNVYLREGSYFIKETVELNALDNNISYIGYEKERVELNGGKKISGGQFKSVTDPKVLMRLPEEARSKVLQLNLHSIGISNFGKRVQHGFGMPMTASPLEVFFNGEPLTVARYPNDASLQIGKVIDPGSRPRSGDFSNRGAIFSYDYDRANRWKEADNAWIYGMFSLGYADDHLKIDKIDFENKTIKTVQPHLYAVASSVDSSESQLAHSRNMRKYFVYNLLEEIDQPGEWFLDEKSGILYVYPLENFASGTIELSELEKPFFSIVNASKVNIKNLTFNNARGLGIFVDDVSDITVSECTFSNLGLLALSMGNPYTNDKPMYRLDGSPEVNKVFDSTSKNVTLSYCTIYNTGAGGVSIAGGNRRKLIAANNKIENCEFHHFSRINQTYSPAIRLNGVGNSIANNYFHDAPHEVIEFNGNNHTIELNHFKNVCTTATDMGAVYSGRNVSVLGIKIRYNYFEEVTTSENSSVCAVYFDDGYGSVELFGNIFYKSGKSGGYDFGAIHINGGFNNKIENNIFIDCERALSHGTWGLKGWKDFLSKPLNQHFIYNEVDIRSKVFQKSYPSIAIILDTTESNPRQNYLERNLLVNCANVTRGKKIKEVDNYITSDDPGFVNMGDKNFAIKKDAPLFSYISGFKSIPFEKIGIRKR
jgi:parallel beta-helix repeat protein